jgi:hypothetical protein
MDQDKLQKFRASLLAEGLTETTAEVCVRYVRAAMNVGQDPRDHARFETYVKGYAAPARGQRRSSWRRWQRFLGVPELPLGKPGRPHATAAGATGAGLAAGFDEYLISHAGMSDATCRVYVGAVRSALKSCGATRIEDLNAEQIHKLEQVRSTSWRLQFRRAWELFRQYQELTGGGAHVPQLDEPTKYPDQLCYAVWYICQLGEIPRGDLATLTWASVDWSGPRIRHATMPGHVYPGHIREPGVLPALSSWAEPDGLVGPLVPLERGGLVPMPRHVLQAVWRQGADLAATGFSLKGGALPAGPTGAIPAPAPAPVPSEIKPAPSGWSLVGEPKKYT